MTTHSHSRDLDGRQAREDISVHVAAVGPFGDAVAGLLQEGPQRVRVTHVHAGRIDDPGTWPHAQVHVLAAWRPCHQLCRDLEALCYQRSSMFVPVVLDAPRVIVGPVVVPGAGPCFSCHRRRLLQHAARPAVARALWDHYDAHPGQGPVGHLSVLADLGAARVAQLLGDGIGWCHAAAGQVWHVNYLTRYAALSRVTGVHGCPRCGLKRDERTRSVGELQPYLAALWSDTDTAPEMCAPLCAGDPRGAVTS